MYLHLCTMTMQWNLMRVLRGAIALWAFWEIYNTGEWLLLIPGVLFGLQAIFNVGCCGSQGCYTTPQNKAVEQSESVVYEEVR